MVLLKKITWVLGLGLALSACLVGQTITSRVDQSKHNLSVSGPGTFKSSTEKGVCIFCHAPHNTAGMKALWNRQFSSQDPNFYTTYEKSPTYQQETTGISDRSKLCLSCHDGTIALGQTIATGNLGLTSVMSGKSKIGPDLRRDHPISFTLPAKDDGEIKDWLLSPGLVSPDPAVKLYDAKIECVTCHEPHIPDIDPVSKKFLVRDNQRGALCQTCHDTNRGELKDTLSSAHALASGTTVNDISVIPYATVAANGCMACHTSHTVAGSGPQLLIDREENTCAKCHSAKPIVSPAPPDVMTDLTTAGRYVHPVVQMSSAHRAGEALPVQDTRHSECEDCHNPHSSRQAQAGITTNAPAVQPAIYGARGMSPTGTALQPAANEYEVCFKCHASSSNKPQADPAYSAYGRNPIRQSELFLSAVDSHNLANQFASLASSHNVSKVLGHTSLSLRDLMVDKNGIPTTRQVSSSTYIYCSDCHNNENSVAAGGGGVNGPHSSKWPHLLERQYEINAPSVTPGGVTDQIGYTPGASGTYALCEKCHKVDEMLINGPDTTFGYHAAHVTKGVSCASCHAPHGVQGTDLSHHGGLIDLDTRIAAYDGGVDANGAPIGIAITSSYTPPAGVDPLINTSTHTCNLVCHGVQHNAAKGNNHYPR